ncbi:MAG: Mpo1-like protein [Steroidobacteraceae bacterium]
MRSVDQWFAEYDASHRHPINKALHVLCVPAIVMTVIGLAASVPVPAAMAGAVPWTSWAAPLALAALIWYALLSPALAIGAAFALALLFAAVDGLAALAWPLWQSCVVIFVLAWIGQFIGHAIEGRRPSFFKDLQFLLIGPLWLLAFLYRAAGLRYARG